MAIMERKHEERPAGTLPATSERTALALALERALAARAARDGAASAIEPAKVAVWRARQRVEDAEAAVAAAKAEAASGGAVSFAAGEVMEAPVALRSARTALVEAQDDLDIAISARDGLYARGGSDEAAVTGSGYALKEAVAAVIRAEVMPSPEALATEVIALQKQLADKAAALMFLVDRAGALPRVEEHGSRFGKVRDREIWTAINRMEMMGAWRDLLEASPMTAALKAAAAALEHDASAPVPAIG